MLKKRFGLFLGLVVLAGSACVTPTHASSAPSVIMTSIQAGAQGDAKKELIILYNQSPNLVDVTNWCVVNKLVVYFACFAYSDSETEAAVATLMPYSYATIASKDFAYGEATPESYYSLTYSVTNQSSGSITAGSDIIQLIDASGNVVDSFSWDISLTPGKAWVRLKLLSEPDTYAVASNVIDWSMQTPGGQPLNSVLITYIPIEHGDDTQESSEDIGVDSELPFENDSELSVQKLLEPYITEVLPNPAGVDAGKEFMELYNPNASDPISLNDITVRIGFDTTKSYAFPEDSFIPPLSYVAFYSSEMKFTLANTKGRLQLERSGVVFGEVVEYVNAKDDMVWAMIDGVWQYSTRATPNAVNLGSLPKVKAAKVAAMATPKPCAANQYRNPATGRCKLLSSGTSTPAACKENQERNPETNRCRNIKQMTSVGDRALQIENDTSNQTRWYYWLGIGGIVAGVMVYAVWEWRDELRVFAKRLKGFVMRRR